MAEPIALAALVIEAAVGWPAALYARVGHPVGGFARLIDRCERAWNAPSRPVRHRRLLGVLTLLVVAATGGAAGALLQWVAHALLGRYGWIGIALAAWPGLAQRSLFDHAAPVAKALSRGDLAAARMSVAMIVGRDVTELDEPGVTRAAIESLAESFCDGIVAPLFWLLLLGLPGLWAYKAINTADSLIGHREERWQAFGWASARTDDGANWIPARWAAVLICVAGGGGWRTMWRDCRRHASPNAGWPEAAMAGALGVALAGPVSYDGIEQDKAWINPDGGSAGAADLRRALRIYVVACALLWLIAGAVAWAA